MASVSGIAPIKQLQGLQGLAAKSSYIAAFEYDQTNLRLTTHMKNGAIYQHAFVVPGEWLGLQTSPSQGKYWADNIRGKKQSIKIKAVKTPTSEIKGGRK